MVLQQRLEASGITDTVRKHASLASEADMKVQALEKLRAVHDDYQKLSNELIPAAEKSLVELRRQKDSLTETHEDV